MNKQILFIQGGGKHGYEADKELVASLKAALGKGYDLHYPEITSDESAPDFGWTQQIANKISNNEKRCDFSRTFFWRFNDIEMSF